MSTRIHIPGPGEGPTTQREVKWSRKIGPDVSMIEYRTRPKSRILRGIIRLFRGKKA